MSGVFRRRWTRYWRQLPAVAVLTVTGIVSATGSAAGAATATGVAASTAESAGSIAGVADVVGVGASTAAAIADSAGIGTGSGVGASTAASVGDAAGSATASGVGEGAAYGTSDGSSTASAVGASTAASPGSSAGVGSASSDGASTAASEGASAGTGAASGVGAATGSGTGTSAGTGTGAAPGASTAAAAGSATGSATAAGVSPSSEVPGDGSAAGSSSATATAWAIYYDEDPATVIPRRQVFTGDGSTVAFVVSDGPIESGSERVYVAGYIQANGVHYTIDADRATIRFTIAPLDTERPVAYFRQRFANQRQVQPAEWARNQAIRTGPVRRREVLTSDGSGVFSLVAPIDGQSDRVFAGPLYQIRDHHYTVSSRTLTFSAPVPPTGEKVAVYYYESEASS